MKEEKQEWIYKKLVGYNHYTCTCPYCGAKYEDNYDGYINVENFNYCPNCGKKVGGEN